MMNSENSGQTCFLIKDFYHWELERNGNFILDKNSFREDPYDIDDPDLQTANLDEITEPFMDE